MGEKRRIPTPEEYEKDKQIILSAYKAGLPMRRMIAKFSYTKTYITNMRKTLIDEGLITEDEIKSAFAEYLKENPAAQGLDKSKARKPKGRERAEKRHNKSLENKEKILELVKQRYTKSQIARKLKITATNVDWHIKKLIEEGKLQSDEVEKESSQSNEDIIDKNAPEYLEQREQVVQCLRKGWKNFYIRKVLNINPYDFDIYIRDIKRKKIMTAEEIKEAREKKRQEDLKFVADAINDGMTSTEIRKLKPEFSYNEVTPMIRELIDAGAITQEKVDENEKNGRRRTMNKAVELSPEEQVQFILDKIKKGYAPAEIVESDKTKSLTMHKVLYQKRQLIAKGIISEEKADKAMQERQKKALARKHRKLINKIKKYTELGYTLTEMAEFITEYNYQSLSRIKNAYIRENSWYTKEELEEFATLRKLREAEEEKKAFESLPPEEKKRIEEERIKEAKRLEEEKRKRQEEIIEKREERKAKTDKKHREDAKALKEYIKSGKTMKEAADLMKFSVDYAYKIRRESVQNETWLTVEELEVIQKEREKKLEKVQEKRKQQKKDEKNRKREENEFRIKEEVRKLREYVKKGYTYEEISHRMGYSISYLQYLRRLAIDENIWFTKEAIKEFKDLREKREILEKEKIRKEEQKRLDKERKEKEKAMKEEEAIRNALNKERKQKIRDYKKLYNTCKKEAKKEDKLELNGEINVSTEGRRKFIDILITLESLEADISDEDIEIVLNTFYMYPELADKNSIKFLISDANRKGGIKSAEMMAVELGDALRNTKFYEPLVEFRRWMRKLNLLPQIQIMKKQGMNNTQIGEKLGISSAEVSILLNNDKSQIFQGIGIDDD